METDVYKIDAEQAIRAVRELAGAIQEQTRVSKEAGEHTTESFFKAELAIRAAEKAYEFLKEQIKDFFKEAIEGAIKAEQVERRLEYATGANAEAFKRQATAMAETIGVSREAVEQMQMFLSKHGEAPGKINATIEAVENWAAANGGDASDALNQLVMASERGTGSVKSLGLHIKSTGEVTQDLALFTAKLNKQWDGAALANAESYAGKIAKIGVESDLLKESVGKFLLEAADKTGIIKNLADEIKYYRKQLFGEDAEEKARATLSFLYNKRAELIGLNEEAEKAHNQLFIDANAYKLKDIERRIKDAEAGVAKLSGAPTGAGTPHATAKAETAEAKSEETAAEVLAQREMKERDQRLKHMQALEEVERNRERTAAAEHEKILLSIKQKGDDLKEREAKIASQKRIKIIEEEAKAEEAISRELGAMAKEAASFALDLIAEQLTANTQFNAKMRDLAIERGEVTDYEGKALTDHAAAQKQLQKEAEAATQARLADFLAALGKEAAMKAIMEAAEGAAALAGVYTAELAPGHLIAAAEFAAVAIAAGVGAAAISGGRGMTASEKGQLQAAQHKDDKAARDSKQASQQDNGGRGPTVNVYYLGITGMTDAERGKELQRVSKEYDKLKTGSGSF